VPVLAELFHEDGLLHKMSEGMNIFKKFVVVERKISFFD
jgi:hypothetical protein